MLSIAILLSTSTLKSQEVSVKTNLLYGATLTPNLGFEVGIGKQNSLELTMGYSPFDYGDNKNWKHILVQPEYRRWLCDKFSGSFFGFNLSWAAYNMGGVDLPFGIWKSLKDYRYQGQAIGAGITYGYQYPLSLHWSIEAEIGIGYWHIWSKKYRCEKCSDLLKKEQKDYVGPSRAAINLIYQF